MRYIATHPMCPLRSDDLLMGNDGYRGCVHLRKLAARVCFTLTTSRSHSIVQKSRTKLNICLPKTSSALPASWRYELYPSKGSHCPPASFIACCFNFLASYMF